VFLLDILFFGQQTMDFVDCGDGKVAQWGSFESETIWKVKKITNSKIISNSYLRVTVSGHWTVVSHWSVWSVNYDIWMLKEGV